MKKILYIETALTGHHKIYFMTLAQAMQERYELHCVLPSELRETDFPVKIVSLSAEKKNFLAQWFSYLRWMRQIGKTIRDVKPDIVHFLYGDALYRYFGFGLGSLKKVKTVVTLHQIRRSRLRDFSVRHICRASDAVVVHTDFLRRSFPSLNLRVIDYPDFSVQTYVQREAKERLGIPQDAPLLLALGGTRRDKGLDLLLRALSTVKMPFFLLIAGEELDFKREQIEALTAGYRKNTFLFLHHFSQEEHLLYLAASDIVVLPYRKSFDGASGPLSEGVSNQKIIVGPEHGSLGELISEYHLGYSFETENVSSLAEAVGRALSEPFVFDSHYQSYREKVSVARFCRSYAELYQKLEEEERCK